MLRGVLTVGGWTAASRILGFVRDMLIAALAGTGPVADAFFVALRLPNLFRRLFGEGAFNAAFVPEFTGLHANAGQHAAQRFAEEALSLMLVALSLFAIFGEIFMPAIVDVLAPGFRMIPGKEMLVVVLARITFPYLVFICLAALFGGLLNSLGRFAAAAASAVVFNAVIIAAMLLLGPFVPTIGHALAWGVTASGMLQLALLVAATRRAGLVLRLRRPRFTPDMRRLLRLMGPGLVGAGATQLNLAVDTIIISWLPPGSASLLNYADRVNQLPLGVIGTALGTALLPLLSRQARSGDAEGAQETLNRAIEMCLALTLPAAFALVAAGDPIMLALFSRGAFTSASAQLAAQSLAGYAVGLPAFVLLKVLVPAFFARGDTRTPMRVALGAIVLNLVLNLLFMVPLRHVGPALATSLAAWANVSALAVLLIRRRWFTADRRLHRRIPRMVLAAGAMTVALWIGERTVFNPLSKLPAGHAVALAVLVLIGLGVYAVLAHLLGAVRVGEALAVLRRRVRLTRGAAEATTPR